MATSAEGVPAPGMKRPHIAILPQTIRGKLVLAFGVVAATAIVAGVVGQSSYEVVNEKLATITEVSLPSMVAAQRIGEVTARIAATAPALHSAATEPELSMQLERLNAHLTELQASVEQLALLSDDADRVRRLDVLAGQIAPLFEVQGNNVKRRLLFAEQSRSKVAQLIDEHLRFNNAIKPTIEADKQAFALSSRRIIEATEQSVDHLNQMSMKGLFPILMLRFQASKMAQAIIAGYRADTEAEIDAPWQAFVSANSIVSRHLGELERNQALAGLLEIEPLREVFSQFTELGAGAANVFDLRREQLGVRAHGPGTGPGERRAGGAPHVARDRARALAQHDDHADSRPHGDRSCRPPSRRLGYSGPDDDRRLGRHWRSAGARSPRQSDRWRAHGGNTSRDPGGSRDVRRDIFACRGAHGTRFCKSTRAIRSSSRFKLRHNESWGSGAAQKTSSPSAVRSWRRLIEASIC